MNKVIGVVLLLLSTLNALGQVSEDFSDGDFTASPAWSGDMDKFSIDTERLRSNYTPTSSTSYYLSTISSAVYDASWEFYIELDFATSSVNYVDVFLVSDQSDLTLTQNGYFVRIGDTADEIVLYKRSGGSNISLIDDNVRRVDGTTNNIFKIRVTRNSGDLFTLDVDDGNVGSYSTVGTATDSDHTSTLSFGMLIVQSTAASVINNHFFDDIVVTGSEYPDVVSPTVESTSVNSSMEILVTFSEEVSAATAEEEANYGLSPSVAILLAEIQADPTQVLLTLGQSLTNGTTYQLSIQNVEDLSGNALASAYQESFRYIVFSTPAFRDVVINEFHPAPGSNSLPNAEYIELFNTTNDSYFQLENWSLEDQSGGTATFPKDTLGPGEYLLIAADTSLFYQYVSRMQVSIPSLNNSGDALFLKDGTDQDIDSIAYTASSANSIEQINPTISFYLPENYTYSTAAVGGTPGLENSVFDDTPDTTPPTVVSREVVGNDSLVVVFNERLQESTAEDITNYIISSQNSSPDWALLGSDQKTVTLFFSAGFTSGLDDEVSITGVKDLFENGSSTSTSFVYYLIEEAAEGDVLINEFLVSPNASEFIELLNVSSKYINLNGWTIEDASGNQLTLPSFRLDPDALVVITSSAGQDSLGVSGFPLLNNSEDEIIVKNAADEVIDQVTYDKFTDGSSFELINPTLTCRGFYNYGLSISGNTSGTTNSLFTDASDVTAPQILELEAKSPDSVHIVFDEPIDPAFDLAGAISFSSAAIGSVSEDGALAYWILLSTGLTSEVQEQVAITGVPDCSGNELAEATFTLYIDEKPPVLEKIGLWSDQELLLYFDELLEAITSADESKFSITGYAVDAVDLVDSLEKVVILTLDQPFEIDQSYTLNVSGLRDTTGNSISSQNLAFQYTTDIQSVSILTSNIIEVTFDSDLDSSNVSAIDRYWLEGTDQPVNVIWNTSNPAKVRLQFAESLADNTALELYIFELLDTDSSLLATPAYSFIYDTEPPVNEEILVQTDSIVLLTFKEALETSPATNPTNFTIADKQVQEAVLIASNQIKLIPAEKLIEENSVTLTYEKLRDLNGNQMTRLRSVQIVYDQTPPRIDSVYQSELKQLIVQATEAIAEGSIDIDEFWYEINGELTYPSDLTISGSNLSATFSDSISQVSSLSIGVTGWADERNNVLEDTLYSNLLTSIPRLTSIQPSSTTSIRLTFNHQMSEANLVEGNYQIDGTSALSVTKESDYYEITIAAPMENGVSYELTLSNLTNVSDESLAETAHTFTFDNFLQSLAIVDTMRVVVEFDLRLDPDNTLAFQIDGQVPDLQSINLDETSQVVLIPKQALTPNDYHQISWSAMTADGQLIPAFVDSAILDKEPPSIVDVISDYFGQLTITFSEELTTSSIENLDTYIILGIGHPTSTSTISLKQAELVFDELSIGESYELIYYNASDLAGNLTEEDTVIFTYEPPALPAIGDIIINELMPDPVPSVGLPEREYIELWNRSETTYNLRGLQISDRTKTVNLPNYELNAGEWVALATASEGGLFVVKEGLPSLDNAGDSITLSTILGTVLDVVDYDLTWYQSTEKQGGGFSLELIDPDSGCPQPSRWKAAGAVGGTPGNQNSVYSTDPDGDPPVISSLTIMSADSILIAFSEIMDTTDANTSDITIALTIDQLSFMDTDQLLITLGEAMVEGGQLSIGLGGFRDCSGTGMSDTVVTVGLPATPAVGDLIISELMADPSPVVGLPESEYLELWNRSDKLLDLSQLTLNGAPLAGTIDSSSYLVLVPSGSISQFSDFNARSVSNWSSLSNTTDSLILEGPDGVLDLVVYDRSWYRNELKSDGGYSLELINPDATCAGAANWRGSEDASGGTPGSQNSVYSTEPDAEAPLLSDFSILSSNQITLQFNEWMDTTMIDLDRLSFPSEISAITFLDLLTCTIELAENLELGTLSEFAIGGFYDCSGNVMSDTTIISGLPATPSIGDIMITEIMADPSPVVGLPEVEYIELFNLTGTLLTLDSLWLNGVNLSGIISPDSYVVLVPDNATGRSLASNAIPISPWISLTNTGETLRLENSDTTLVILSYENEWHEDSKQDGGYSLEIIDPYLYCDGRSNWRSSESNVGGTPGLQNSVWQLLGDQSGPQLLDVSIIDSLTLEAAFDEIALLSGSAWILGDLQIESVTYSSDEKMSTQIRMKNNLPYNTFLTLEVLNLPDCYGNVSGRQTTEILRPETSIDELYINEILFDPKSGSEDFVELYNGSEGRYIDLSALQWFSGTIVRNISEEPLILSPGGFFALTENSNQLLFDYPQADEDQIVELDRVPPLANDEGYLVIKDQDGKVLDSVYYEAGFHSPLLGETEGVSLERLSVDYPAISSDNWASASSVAGFATPGFANSQKLGNIVQENPIEVSPRVFVPGSSNPARPSFTTISYEMPVGSQFANVHIYDQNGRVVRTLGEGIILGTDGFLTWDGSTDQGGTARLGQYIVVFELYGGSRGTTYLKKPITVGREF